VKERLQLCDLNFTELDKDLIFLSANTLTWISRLTNLYINMISKYRPTESKSKFDWVTFK